VNVVLRTYAGTAELSSIAMKGNVRNVASYSIVQQYSLVDKFCNVRCGKYQVVRCASATDAIYLCASRHSWSIYC